MHTNKTDEQKRLDANAKKEVPLEKWGPYLSERQWGTVREDYSTGGDAWNYFTHDHARSRTYLWGEDGIGGISDFTQNICFAIALWNGKDPILKERLFGLTNLEGNHGEDVKELYYYLDNIPTHYYMKYLYKYPQAAFPYDDLVKKNRERSKQDPEYEILDTGVFDDNKYFDVFIEYAKKNSEDIFIRIEIINRSREAAPLTVLPTLWFYNRWQYGGLRNRPSIQLAGDESVLIRHEREDDYYLYFQNSNDQLFTENETNFKKLFGKPNNTELVKDAFHDAIIENKNRDVLRAKKQGTKFAPVYELNIAGKDSHTIMLRLTNKQVTIPFDENFDALFTRRKKEADDFYDAIITNTSAELINVQRQAFAGLLWSKQYYHLDLERWLNISDGITPVSQSRLNGRDHSWKYLKNQDVISMPDKWEYPWYAAWDTAFHAITMAIVDPAFAKNQLLLLMREWYMNPEGQLPAYEWDFSDVNPPVHAFAALEVYHIEKKERGKGDITFLKKIFQKLIINFTWWVNRKDLNGNNIFEGGFLGLDNIGIFNRNIQLPNGIILEQTDGTSWMGMYALNMMDIALEIAINDKSFEDAATKFYEHFVIIAEALNELGLWNETDNFFYDILSLNGIETFPLTIRSIVGLIPLFAVSIIKNECIKKLTDFNKRMHWFREYRLLNKKFIPSEQKSNEQHILLSLVHKERLILLLKKFLNEEEFLSPGGIRGLSKHYLQNPYSVNIDNKEYTIMYDPADSTSSLFGGNSNWRGPVWMPINYIFIKALHKYGEFYGDTLTVEFPEGSGNFLNLKEVAAELIKRITHIFAKDEQGNLPVYGNYNWFYQNENSGLVQFYEYFHGDTSRGLGASHQTGWTALIINLLCSS
jgi:Glycosyl hydrolase family 63 C-terminal domain